MEPIPVQVPFFTTSGGNKVCNSTAKNMSIEGSYNPFKNISMDGNNVIEDGVILRGDLESIKIGRYTILCKNCVIRPPSNIGQGEIQHLRMSIGSHVLIGESSIVQSALIHNYVQIGRNCVIGPRCIIKECSKIEDNTVLPPDTVVPAFTVYSGNPAKYKGDLPESTEPTMRELTTS
ncbi:dynactin, partial [Acrasis kona]